MFYLDYLFFLVKELNGSQGTSVAMPKRYPQGGGIQPGTGF